MNIHFDQQDVADSIHVYVAIRHNNGFVEGSRPHHVHVEMNHTPGFGFWATGIIDGVSYRLDQQMMKDAVAAYLSEYYSFAADRLLINLTYHEPSGTFGADIVVTR
jgi:hypothetical protein